MPRRLHIALACVSALAAAAGAGCNGGRWNPRPTGPRTYPFTETAAPAGIRFEHRNGQGAGANIVETTGAGCALFDYDNDGWLDAFLINGESPPGAGNRLYRNNGNGTFTDVTAAAGLGLLGTGAMELPHSIPGQGIGMGCAVGDVDGDGYLDLYVTYFGRNTLYRNLGDGRFQDVSARAGVACGGFSAAAAFADLDGDQRLDLYVARYCEFNSRSKQLCNASGVPTSCPPYYYRPEPDVVYRNAGNLRFRDVTREWGMKNTSGRGLGVIPVDYDRDGRLDLFVANDGSPNFLYRNVGLTGRPRFRNVAATEGIGLNRRGSALANMGADFGDCFGDGTFAATTGVFQNEVHPLWRYRPGGGFEEVSEDVGIAPSTLARLTFGLGFADLDNDGWLDLFLANGHVQDHIAKIDRACTYEQPRTYLRNTGAAPDPLRGYPGARRFEDLSQAGGPAVTAPAVGRGLAFGDVDHDGDIDMLVNNNNGRAMLIRNDHPRRNWLQLRLISRGRCWEAIGAVAELYAGGRRQTRFVHPAYSFASANDHRLHFGLAGAPRVERIVVRWPDGSKTERRDVPVNQFVTIVQPGASPPAPVQQLIHRRAASSRVTHHASLTRLRVPGAER